MSEDGKEIIDSQERREVVKEDNSDNSSVRQQDHNFQGQVLSEVHHSQIEQDRDSTPTQSQTEQLEKKEQTSQIVQEESKQIQQPRQEQDEEGFAEYLDKIKEKEEYIQEIREKLGEFYQKNDDLSMENSGLKEKQVEFVKKIENLEKNIQSLTADTHRMQEEAKGTHSEIEKLNQEINHLKTLSYSVQLEMKEVDLQGGKVCIFSYHDNELPNPIIKQLTVVFQEAQKIITNLNQSIKGLLDIFRIQIQDPRLWQQHEKNCDLFDKLFSVQAERKDFNEMCHYLIEALRSTSTIMQDTISKTCQVGKEREIIKKHLIDHCGKLQAAIQMQGQA